MSRHSSDLSTKDSRNYRHPGDTVTQKGKHGPKKSYKEESFVPTTNACIPTLTLDRTGLQRMDSVSKSQSPSLAPPEGISRKNPIGLCNFGNSCYFNSVLQSLSHTPTFHQELLKATEKLGDLGNSFIRIALELIGGVQQPVVDPSAITYYFTAKVPRFANTEQHDSHECLRHFLEELRKEERESEGSSPSNNQLTVVDKIFGGHLVTVYVCEECDKHYHLFEPCLDISLPVFFESESRKDENQMRGQKFGKKTDQKLPKDEQSSHDCSEPMDDDGCTVSSRHSEKPQRRGSDRNRDPDKGSEIKPKKATGNSRGQKHFVDMNEIGYKEAIKTLMGRLAPIPDDPNSKSSAGEYKRSEYSRPISLSDCFKHFSRVEQIIEEYLCEDCLREAMARGEADEDHLKLTSATKQTLIFNPPAILTIHFKRFELLPGKSRKRSDKVEYPKDLDIAHYCSSQCLRNDPPRNNIWYSLYAVIVHSGSLEFGHYMVYVREKSENIEQVKNFLQNEYFNHNVTSEELIMMMQKKTQPTRKEGEESNWYLIDDRNVRKADIKEVLRQEAYLLFYERIPSVQNPLPATIDNSPVFANPQKDQSWSHQKDQSWSHGRVRASTTF